MGGNLAEAEKIAAQGLAEPRPPAYLYYLHAALLLKRQSKAYDRILRELAVAARALPACSLCYLAASKAHEAEGEPARAIADLETAVRVDPGFSEAWYRLAPLYQRAGRAAQATRARGEFQKLKATKQDRETEMLRRMFLETLSEAPPSSPRP
jgi:cytochrome c-type biogenesis protein CcmH/NrfG